MQLLLLLDAPWYDELWETSAFLFCMLARPCFTWQPGNISAMPAAW
jgi:hypothetical protein